MLWSKVMPQTSGVSAATPSRADAIARANDNARPTDAQSARSLIAQSTNVRTGVVDTARLANMVADAARQNPGAANGAYAAIRRELGAQNIGDLSRFERDVTTAMRTDAGNQAGYGTGVTAAGIVLDRAGTDALQRGATQMANGTRILTQNPILSVRWEATTSAWTGLGGLHPDLATRLRAGGVEVVTAINAPPAGSVSRGAGISQGRASNMNGGLAENMIANRYRADGFAVTQGANMYVGASSPNNVVQGGQRVIDVVAERGNANPRLNERIEVESKVGFTRDNGRAAREATNDIQRLADNRAARASGEALEAGGAALSRTGRVLSVAGKIAKPVGVVMDALEIRQAFIADGNRIGENTGRAASSVAGGAAGAWGGAAAGAAIGSIVPGVGTIIGGVVGGIIGGIAGSELGKGIFNAVSSWF
jgi:hypothetical protein